uniref:Uncharacterized protein n=1 Tax=Parascaris equorum TaxID=6256 RepID=A0A914R3M1_PAREQ
MKYVLLERSIIPSRYAEYPYWRSYGRGGLCHTTSHSTRKNFWNAACFCRNLFHRVREHRELCFLY